MSGRIDERVVQMRFEGDQFSEGVQETADALDKLKDALKLEDVSANVDKIGSAFSVFGAVAFSAIQKLTGSAMEFGNQIAGAILDPLVEGGKRRALNIEQAKFQFRGLGMDVEASMASAKEAVLGTAFGLDEAARLAAIFGASGMQAGTQMTAALRGVAGVAALSGASFSDIGDIFSDVAGKGRAMGEDFNRLSARGVNGAAVLSKALGVTQEEVLKMASKGEISFDIFSNAMNNAFGEHATKAADTYTGALAQMKTALARIGAEFADDDFERQRVIFNALSVAIDKVKAALAPLAPVWARIMEASGRSTVNMIKAVDFTDVTNAMVPFAKGVDNLFTLWKTLGGVIKSAFSEVFPPAKEASTVLTDLAKGFKSVTDGLLMNEAAQQNLKMVLIPIFQVLKLGWDIMTGVIRVVFSLAGFVINLAMAFGTLLGPVLTFIRGLLPITKGAGDAKSAVSSFFDMLVTGIGWLNTNVIPAILGASKALDTFLNGGVVTKRVEAFKNALGGLGQAIASIWNILTKGDFTGNPLFSEDSKLTDFLFKIRDAFIGIGKVFSAAGDAIGAAGNKAQSFWAGVVNVMKTVWGYISPLFASIGNIFKQMTGDLDIETILATINTGVLVGLGVAIARVVKGFAGIFAGVGDIKKSLVGVLDELGGALGRFQQETMPEKLIKIAVALIVLAGALFIISQIDPNRLVSSVTAMAAAFAIMLGGIYLLEKIDAEPSMKVAFAIAIIAAAVLLMAQAVAVMGQMGIEQLAAGLVATAIAMGLLIGAAYILANFDAKQLTSLFQASAALLIISTALSTVAGVVALMGLIPWSVLSQGLIVVGIMLGGLVAAAILLSNFAPTMILSAVGLMAMAVALNMLVAPVLLLGITPWPVLLQGMAALGIMLGGLVAAAILLSALAPAMILSGVGILAMATALAILVGPVLLLGAVPFAVIQQGILALAGVMAVLVLAALAMNGAVVGAAGMITMAAAMLILAVAVVMLQNANPDKTAAMLLLLLGAFIGFAALSAILTPLVPVMVSMAAVMVIIGLAALMLGASLMVAAIGISLMGPALMALVGGIKSFSAASGAVMGSIGPMMLLGAALLILGTGAAIAGVGFLLLGAGLVLLAAGFALVGITGLIGATVLSAVVLMLSKLVDYVPGIVLLSAGLGVLGLATSVLGLGMMSVAVGAAMLVGAFIMLVAIAPILVPTLQTLIAMIPTIFQALADGIIGFVTTLGGLIPIVVAQFTLLVSSILIAIGTLVPQAVATFMGVVQACLNAIVQGVPMFVVAGMQLIIGVINGIAANIGGVITAGANLIIAFLNGISANVPRVIQAAVNLVINFVNSLANGIRSNASRMQDAGMNLAQAIIDGMVGGIGRGISSVINAAKNMAESALNAAKNFLGINSPSREFTKIGAFSAEGLAMGIVNSASIVEKAGTRMGDAALSATQDALMRIKDSVMLDPNMTPTITPVLDLSAIKKDSGLIGGILTPPTLKVSDSYAVASSLVAQNRSNDTSSNSDNGGTDVFNRGGDTYIQNNYSPKALSAGELYRNTKNLISVKKVENPT